MMPTLHRRGVVALLLAASLAACSSTADAQGTAADTAHWRATRSDLDSIARDKTAPAYSKRAQSRIRVRDSLRLVGPVTPPPPPASIVRDITISASATSVKLGDTVSISAIPRDASGTPINVPLTWTAEPSGIGTLTPGFSSATFIAKMIGTARLYVRADTVRRLISIAILDSAVIRPDTAPAPAPPPVTGMVGPAKVAELPRTTPADASPGCTTIVRVVAGGDLQAALTSATPGVCVYLAPGATFVGNFILPDKGSGSSWITLRTDVTDAMIGTPGTRMTPARAATANLARILTPNNQPALATALSAHHWRVTGIELGGTATADEINGIIRLGDGSSAQNSLAFVAHDLILDRSYVHGTSSQAVRRCVNLQSASTSILDSWISDCHSNNGDSQAIVGWNGPGPYLIRNNHLEGGHQGLFFGGADPFIANLSPSDITVVGNHITRPLAWKGIWQTKTIIETKNARRMLIEGNVIDNVWPDAQTGYGVLLKSENQNGTAPWTQSTDITIRYNLIQNAAAGFNIAAAPGWAPAVPAARLTITDNDVRQLGSPYGGDAIPVQLLGKLSDIIFAHNAFVNALNQALSCEAGPATTSILHSNILPHGMYGVKCSGFGDGRSSLDAYLPAPSLFSVNMLTQASDCSSYPIGTLCVVSLPSVLPMGYDARAVGAAAAIVAQKTANVVTPAALSLARRARPMPTARQTGYTPTDSLTRVRNTKGRYAQ